MIKKIYLLIFALFLLLMPAAIAVNGDFFWEDSTKEKKAINEGETLEFRIIAASFSPPIKITAKTYDNNGKVVYTYYDKYEVNKYGYNELLEFKNSQNAAHNAGDYFILVSLSDKQETKNYGPLYVTVKEMPKAQEQLPKNSPPVLKPVGDYAVYVGQTLNFKLDAFDADGDGIYYFIQSYGLFPSGVLDGSTGRFSWTPTEKDAGIYDAVFAATDYKSGTSTQSSKIEVRKEKEPIKEIIKNIPPMITNKENAIEVNEGETLRYIISATDIENDDVKFKFVSSTDPSISIAQDTGEIIFKTNFDTVEHPKTREEFIVYIAAFDKEGESEPFMLKIAVNDANRHPLIDIADKIRVKENEITGFRVEAQDPDGDELEFSAISLPQGSLFNPLLRLFAWKPSFEQQGNYLITFKVKDSMGAEISKAIQAEVTDVNRAPKVTISGKASITDEETLELIISAKDDDNDELKFGVETKIKDYSFKESDVNEWLFKWKPLKGTEGNFDIKFSVTDNKGITEKIIKVQVSKIVPEIIKKPEEKEKEVEIKPINRAPISPLILFPPDRFSFAHSKNQLELIYKSTDPDSNNIDYIIEWGDMKAEYDRNAPSGAERKRIHLYPPFVNDPSLYPQNYKISVTACDFTYKDTDKELCSLPTTIRVTVKDPYAQENMEKYAIKHEHLKIGKDALVAGEQTEVYVEPSHTYRGPISVIGDAAKITKCNGQIKAGDWYYPGRCVLEAVKQGTAIITVGDHFHDDTDGDLIFEMADGGSVRVTVNGAVFPPIKTEVEPEKKIEGKPEEKEKEVKPKEKEIMPKEELPKEKEIKPIGIVPPAPPIPEIKKVKLKFGVSEGLGSVTATYIQDGKTLKDTVSETGIKQAIMPASSKTITVDKGTKVTLTAKPAENYAFEKWDNSQIINPLEFIADSDINLLALFKIILKPVIFEEKPKIEKVKLTFGSFTGAGSGSVAAVYAEDGQLKTTLTHDKFTVNVDKGTKVALTANPNIGWEFKNWNNDADKKSNPFIIDKIASDTTMLAVFGLKEIIPAPTPPKQPITPEVIPPPLPPTTVATPTPPPIVTPPPTQPPIVTPPTIVPTPVTSIVSIAKKVNVRKDLLSIKEVKIPRGITPSIGDIIPVEIAIANEGKVRVNNAVVSVNLADSTLTSKSYPNNILFDVPVGKTVKKTALLEISDDLNPNQDYFVMVVSRNANSGGTVFVPLNFR